MKTGKNYLLMGFLVASVLFPVDSYGAMEDKSAGHEKHAHGGASEEADMDMPNQLAEMRAKGAQLESALDQNHQGKVMGKSERSNMEVGMMTSPGGQGMGMMGDKSGMGMRKMGMMGMGKMKMANKEETVAQNKTAPPALPAFPGAFHLYHMGATNYFLDYGDRLNLTSDQQEQIVKVQEAAALDEMEIQKEIEKAEQELWKLTASDQPDIVEIEKKIRDIEKMKADQRLAFIHSVGHAASLLSDAQRRTITDLLKLMKRHR